MRVFLYESCFSMINFEVTTYEVRRLARFTKQYLSTDLKSPIREGRNVEGVRYEKKPRALISRLICFLNPLNAQTIEATTACTAVCLPYCKHQVLVFTVEWTGALPMGEQW